MPLGATFQFIAPFTHRLIVTFDQPLSPGPVSGLNWLYHHPVANQYLTVNPGTAAGATVTLNMVAQVGPADPPSRCDYAGTPPDVLAVDLTPAAPFTGYPTILLPPG